MKPERIKCPKCGKQIEASYNFCGYCGASLKKSSTGIIQVPSMPKSLIKKIDLTREHLIGSRRNVSVVFADISGFTRSNSPADPEMSKDMKKPVFQRLSEVIYKYEGYIDKFMGDCIMVLFGAPLAHENDPLRAALCSLELQEVIKEFDGIKLSIGINFGNVVAGRLGSNQKMDYTVIGDTVNLAQRIMSSAGPGEILASQKLFELTKKEIKYSEASQIKVKGKKEPVTVYIPISTISAYSHRNIFEHPIIGRESELDRLSAAYKKASAGKGNIINIIGEAGIGKSKMVFEFEKRIRGKAKIYKGWCIEYLRGVAYFPIKEILRGILSIQDGSSDSIINTKLDNYLSDIPGNELKRICPYLKYLFSLKVSEAERVLIENIKYSDRHSIFNRYLSLLFKEISMKRDLVLIIDDLHWADQATMDFINTFCREIGKSRVLLILLWRPGLSDKGDYCILPVPDYSNDIKLELFSKTEASRLICNILSCKSADESLTGFILKRSEGNPFYIEELTASLLSSDMIKVRGNGTAVLKKEGFTGRIPAKLQELIFARIDKLEPRLKKIIQLASVIGTEFSSRVLKQVVDNDLRLETVMHRIQQNDIIKKNASISSSSENCDEFLFKHKMVRDVVYESLLLSERKQYHELIGNTFESIYSENPSDYLDILVYHFKLSNNYEKYFRYLVKLADKEHKAGSYAKAERLYSEWFNNKKAERYKNSSGIEVSLDYCHVKTSLSRFNDSMAILNDIEANTKNLLKGELLIKYNLAKWACLASTGKLKEALSLIQDSVLLAEKLESMDKKLLAKSFASLGSTFYFAGNFDLALKHYNRALKIISENLGKYDPMIPNIYNNIGGVYFRKRNYDKVLEFLNKSLQLAEEAYGENHPQVASYYNNIGVAYYYKRDFDKVIRYHQKALDIQRKSLGDMHIHVAISCSNIGNMLLEKQDYESARKSFQESLEIDSRVLGENHQRVGKSYNGLGLAYSGMKRYKEALECYKKALAILSDSLGPQHADTAMPLFGLAEVNFISGNYKKAGKYIDLTVRIREEKMKDNIMELGKTYLLAGKIYHRLNKPLKSKKFIENAMVLGSKADAPWLEEAESLARSF